MEAQRTWASFVIMFWFWSNRSLSEYWQPWYSSSIFFHSFFCLDGHFDRPTTDALKAVLPWQIKQKKKKEKSIGQELATRVMCITHCADIQQHIYMTRGVCVWGDVYCNKWSFMSEVKRANDCNYKKLYWLFDAKGLSLLFLSNLCVFQGQIKRRLGSFLLTSTCTHTKARTAFCRSNTIANKWASCYVSIQVESLRVPSSLSSLRLSTVPGQKRLRVLSSSSPPFGRLRPRSVLRRRV